MTSFRAGAGGAGVWTALSRDGGAGRCHCSFGEPSPNPASPAQVGATSELSIHLANTVHPTLVVTLDPAILNARTQLNLFQHLLHIGSCFGSCCRLP